MSSFKQLFNFWSTGDESEKPMDVDNNQNNNLASNSSSSK